MIAKVQPQPKTHAAAPPPSFLEVARRVLTQLKTLVLPGGGNLTHLQGQAPVLLQVLTPAPLVFQRMLLVQNAGDRWGQTPKGFQGELKEYASRLGVDIHVDVRERMNQWEGTSTADPQQGTLMTPVTVAVWGSLRPDQWKQVEQKLNCMRGTIPLWCDSKAEVPPGQGSAWAPKDFFFLAPPQK